MHELKLIGLLLNVTLHFIDNLHYKITFVVLNFKLLSDNMNVNNHLKFYK